ncbi:MAG: nicotinate phosphoribosyltransferase [Methermicoccaceae archaeon]
MAFNMPTYADIKAGKTTDVYFLRTERVLEERGVNPLVVAEVTSSSRDLNVFAGLDDALELLEGLPIDVYAMREGTIFYPREPVLYIVGRYLSFAHYETSLLGFLCQASGIASSAASIRLAAGTKPVISFGTRRVHPALAHVVERSAWIGGVDGVSNVSAAEALGIDASGTMPHSLIVCFGDQVAAWRAFDEVLDEKVPRVCLCDTYCDEKTESIMAAQALGGRLNSVRLDTPSSRRGSMRSIVEEVRHELDIRGFSHVGIFVSGSMHERSVAELVDIVDGFGVGTTISAAPPIDLALDIVEKEGKPCAKRGKWGGRKQVWRNWDTLEGRITSYDAHVEGMEPVLEKVMESGKPLVECDHHAAREHLLSQLEVMGERV